MGQISIKGWWTIWNKRGQEDPSDIVNSGYGIFLFMIFLGAVMAVYLLLLVDTTEQYVPEDLSKFLYAERFTNNCFSYTDGETGRKYTTIIDARLFHEEVLRECYFTTPGTISYSYSLRLHSDTLDRTITTANHATLGESYSKQLLLYNEGVIEKAVLTISTGEKR